MLQIIEIDTGYRSVVACDICGHQIDDAGMAVAVRFTDGNVWHLHKGRCHDQAERAVPAFRIGFLELRHHLAQIEHHTNAGAVAADVRWSDDGPVDLPAPRQLAERCMARAWADDTDDASRVLLELGARTITHLLARLAMATERAEARRAT
jgi:hypothetical protein